MIAQSLVGPDTPLPELQLTRQNVRADTRSGLRCATGTVSLARPWMRPPFDSMRIGHFVEIQSSSQAAPVGAGRYVGIISTKGATKLLIGEAIDDNVTMSIGSETSNEPFDDSEVLYGPLLRTSLSAAIPDAQIAIGDMSGPGCTVSDPLDLTAEVPDDTTRGPYTAMTVRFLGSVTAADYRREPPVEDAKNVVVNLRNAQGQTIGAGITIDRSGNYLYIMTCRHVVWSGDDPVPDITVTFFSAPSKPFPAVVMNASDVDLDLALVGVQTSTPGLPAVKQFVVGSVDDLSLGGRVRSIGHPSGVLWRVAGNPERFSRRTGADFEFETGIADEGSSGGGVFNACGGLIGMTKRAGNGLGVATRIDRILDKLVTWNFTVQKSPTKCLSEQ